MAHDSAQPHLPFAERDAVTSELFARLAAVDTPEQHERIVEQIVQLYLDLCSSMAGRYRGRGIEYEDLVQVARLALVKAVRRYEPGHAPCFAAYAVPTISGELKRWFRDRGWVVRPTRRLQELRGQIQSVRAQLEQELGASPSDADLAKEMRATVEEVREVAAASTGFRPLSLDFSRSDGSDDVGPNLAAFLATSDDALEGADDRVSLSAALGHLNDGERELIRMRYVEGMTQREIGEARGVSQMQVSRDLSRLMLRLHSYLVEQPSAPQKMSNAS